MTTTPTAPLRDFGRLMSRIFRFAKTLSFGLIGLMAVFLAFRVAEIYQFFERLHPLAGYAFLAVFTMLFLWLVVRPIYQFLKMPVVIRPPDLPPKGERRLRHLVRHLEFVERYVRNLIKNPAWEGTPDQVEAAVAACQRLRAKAEGAKEDELEALAKQVRELERTTVGALLAPLDRQASEIIRREAMGVGVATAVSWNGTVDAFVVLWRNCNLVTRLARLYYGRPGARGSLSILRDVAAATLTSAYMQDLSETAGSALGTVFGKTVGVLAGPVMDGGINAVATLRIGYVAKARCRAFEAWNERTRVEAIGAALKEAAGFSKDVVTEVVRTVGGGLLGLPGKVLGKMGDALSGIWKKRPDDGEPSPAGA